MTQAFARNLQTRLGESGTLTQITAPPAAELNAGSLFLSALWDRIKAFVRALLRR
jgi:hypothetical protein